MPANVAHLALRRPYIVPGSSAPPVIPAPLGAIDPFRPTATSAAEAPAVSKEAAADFYQTWLMAPDGGPWDALEAVWQSDPIAVRRAFREEMKQDWPVSSAAGPRAEANRLAVARWVRRRWEAAVRQRVADRRRAMGLRGEIAFPGPVDADLSFLAAGEAANHPEPLLVPRVTGDPDTDRFGVGFVLRLAADLGNRIPLPGLDLSSLREADAPWAVLWLDEAVRNGVSGLDVVMPQDAAARERVEAALEPLRAPRVFLPPPGEVGVLVSRDTATLEPGAWVAAFRVYAALRGAGLWPNFISDEQVEDGSVSLARFDVIVIPAARWAARALPDAVAAWVERGGTAIVTDPLAFTRRAEDGWDTATQSRRLLGWASAEAAPEGTVYAMRVSPATGTRVLESFADGAPAVTERTLGDGRILASLRAAPPASFWRDAAARAKVNLRPWLENTTISNVGRITGTYTRPTPAQPTPALPPPARSASPIGP